VTLLHLLEAGDHIVCIDDVYGGTQRYFRRVASNFHLEFSFVDFEDMQKVKAALRKNTKLIWIESPTNPTMKVW
jgi:cystathionine gamma-lyase